jgi:hypothetical protein
MNPTFPAETLAVVMPGRFNLFLEKLASLNAGRPDARRRATKRKTARIPEAMRDISYPSHENGGLSAGHVWSTIRYLDPEEDNQNARSRVLALLIGCLIIWLLFFASMYLLGVRASDSVTLPIISTSRR